MSRENAKILRERLQCLSVQRFEADGVEDLFALDDAPTVEQNRLYLQYEQKNRHEAADVVTETQKCLSSQSSNAGDCLQKSLYDGLKAGSDLSEDGRYVCKEVNKAFKKTSAAGGDSYDFQQDIQYLFRYGNNNGSKDSPRLSAAEMAAIYDVARFHSSRLRSWTESVSQYVAGAQSLKKSYALYSQAPAVTTVPTPLSCINATDFRRKDLPITGLEKSVAVYYPKQSRLPEWLYEAILQAHFEVIKGVVRPEDMNRLLAPGNGRRDLSLLIASRQKDQKPVLEKCDVYPASEQTKGKYLDEAHRIALLNSPWELTDSERTPNGAPLWPIAGDTAGTFYHELGHAIDSVFLTTEARNHLEALFRRVSAEAASQPEAVPQPHHLVEGKPYSLKNSYEFFAQLVEEYVESKATGRKPIGAHAAARFRLMSDFFSPKGINPSAFSKENLEHIYREAGLDLTLRQNRWRIPARLGFHFTNLTLGNAKFESADFMLGTGLEFSSSGDPSGLIFGGGIQFDFNPAGQALAREAEGPVRSATLRALDLGAYGLLGYSFPSLAIQIQTGLGYRHLQADQESLHLFWLGTDLGFEWKDPNIGIGIRGRYLPGGGSTLGLFLQTRLPW